MIWVVSRLSRESLIPCLLTTKAQTNLHSLMSTFVVRFLQGMVAKLATWIAVSGYYLVSVARQGGLSMTG